MRRAALLAVVLVAIGPRDVVCDEGSLDEYGDFDEENEEGLDEFGEPIVPPAAAVVEEEPIDPPAAAVVEEVEEAMVPGHAGHKEAHRAIEAEEEARQQFYNSIGNDEVRPRFDRGLLACVRRRYCRTRRRRCRRLAANRPATTTTERIRHTLILRALVHPLSTFRSGRGAGARARGPPF